MIRLPAKAAKAGNPAHCHGKIETPALRNAAGNTAFSFATPSIEPNSATWAGATKVVIATSGEIISAKGAISPGPLMPASTTANLCTPCSSRVNVSGTPR